MIVVIEKMVMNHCEGGEDGDDCDDSGHNDGDDYVDHVFIMYINSFSFGESGREAHGA